MCFPLGGKLRLYLSECFPPHPDLWDEQCGLLGGCCAAGLASMPAGNMLNPRVCLLVSKSFPFRSGVEAEGQSCPGEQRQLLGAGSGETPVRFSMWKQSLLLLPDTAIGAAM